MEIDRKPPSDIPTSFVDPKTGRHVLDVIYERFSKPQANSIFDTDDPSIYVKHEVGDRLLGGYRVEAVFEDSKTGFYAEARMPEDREHPPVLVIRGYGSWYPFDGVLQDTPDVFIAELEWQVEAAETVGVGEWIETYYRQDRPPDAIGESLGGKIVQQLAIRYPHALRSVVTFNSLGISSELAKNHQIKNVFHYFTLGEKYAFWANRGDYLPGSCFEISKRGKNWQYRLTQMCLCLDILAVVRSLVQRQRKRVKLWRFARGLFSQFILLKRHNEVILNRDNPVVVPTTIARLRKS
ncbi:hypothetical protein JJD41_05475 [Oxynema sp. CENA135]|uniref:hypothetical protein n=1 Tax=Oxynema sp. CENA135 TaxID=984206 RepID=UPI00190A806D|nr:hypothetical protein [Oxynema sp. CENA135]MBK4729338.1 hypothetical protein [Oxynema sp. CENA135]